MADTPWGVVPEVSDRLSFMNDSFKLSPKNIPDLFDDVIPPPSPHYDPHGQNMNYLTPFDSPMCNFGNNANMPSDVRGEGGESNTNPLEPIVSLTDHQMYEARSASNSVDDDPLHILRAEAETGINPLAEIFGRRRSRILLEDHLQILPAANHPSQLYGAGESVSNPLDDHPMPIFGAGGESSINPLAEIFERSTILLEDPLQILPATNQPSQLFRVGESVSNPQDDHLMPIFRAGGESSITPPAEIFGRRRSTILLKHPLQILHAENHPLQLYEAKDSVSNALDDHPIPIFRAGGELTINPLAEIFGERKNAVLLGHHSSLDDQPEHISRVEGELSLGRNLNHNPESFRNNNMLPPLLMDQLSRQPIHSNCIGCHVLKEVLYYNHNYIIKLEIHGKWGVICHAIQERRARVLNNYGACKEPIYERFDFHSKSLNEVKHFLTHYCQERKAEGYIRQPDHVQSFLQGFYVPMKDEDEWEEVLSYPEEFIYEVLDSEDFGPRNTNAMERLFVDKASSSKGKGKMRGRPPKLHRFYLAEQRERAAKMKLDAQRERAASIKLEDLRVYFHLNIEEASEKLRLPIAILNAISKEISSLQPMLLSYRKGTRDYIAARIEKDDFLYYNLTQGLATYRVAFASSLYFLQHLKVAKKNNSTALNQSEAQRLLRSCLFRYQSCNKPGFLNLE
ncbi:hypothetical protein ACLB2K_073795 [Fragaria x ananassa]